MSSARAFFVLLSCTALAALSACGGTTDGGKELAPPAAPQQVTASQGDYSDLVVVAWAPVAETDSYLVLRDGEQIGEVDATDAEVSSYEDLEADPGDSFADPDQVEASYTEEGVEVSWAPVDADVGTAHEYTVVAVNAAGESEPSDSAQGYRAASQLAYYEVQINDSAQWVNAGDQTAWVDDDLPMPVVQFGELSATEGTAHGVVELSAEQPEVSFGPQTSYRVRAVDLDGQPTDASEAAAPATEPDSFVTQWQRTEISQAVADYEPLDEACASLLTCTDTAPADDEAVRYYRLASTLEVDDLVLEDASSPVPGYQYACDVDASPFGGGDGSEQSPWRICSAQQFANIADANADHFVLATSIDLIDLLGSFEPIRTFYGHLDGRGKTIDNFRQGLDASSGWDGVGLFREIKEGARVSNLKVTNLDIFAVADMGGLAAQNAGEISNVEVSGSVTLSDDETYRPLRSNIDHVGGIVGENLETGVIDGCTSSVDVTVETFSQVAGGIAGKHRGVVKNSLATGDVHSSFTAGGVAGRSFEGRIEASKATGNISGQGNVGGLVGKLRYSAVVVDSYATGDVSGQWESTGGLVGANEATIRRSYATGQVSGDPQPPGGLVGTDNVINGDGVTGETLDAYWDEQTTGQSESVGGSALQTADFADPANFPGWSFAPDDDHVWKMGTDADGNDRPVLWWE